MGGALTDFPGFEEKTIQTDDVCKFKDVCNAYLEDGRSKGEQGISKINHFVFSPSTGTKIRLGVVERYYRTFREKYMKYVKRHQVFKSPKKIVNFNVAIPDILKDNNTQTH